MAERNHTITGFARELGFAEHKLISNPLQEFWSSRMSREAFLRCRDSPKLTDISTEFLQERGEEFWGALQDRPLRYPQQSDEIEEWLVKILRQQRNNQQHGKRKGHWKKRVTGKRKDKKNNPRQETIEGNGNFSCKFM